MRVVKLGIVGTGGMANGHAKAFADIAGCRVIACCDIVPGRAQAFAQTHGIPAAYEDLEAMLDGEKLDAVSVVTNDGAHCPAALAALRRKLHVMSEKPLADNLRDARRMTAAAARAGVITAVNFSYRNAAATQKAAEIAASGKLGRILHVEGSYLQSWLVAKHWGDWRSGGGGWLWRLSTRHGSAGCLGDIGVHLYDLASFVVGDIAEIDCRLATFDKGVKGVGEYVFDANDSFISTVHFRNGALGTLHSSRWAVGHVNTVALCAYGDRGSIDLNLDRPDEDKLRICSGKDVDPGKWTPVACKPTPSMYERFIRAIRTGRQGQTSFAGAARVQAYLDASFRSDKAGQSIKIR